ncbi:HNH endonuclease [Pseudoalteromonas tetraodonis]|uniref:HNH endonuclease n=1 Tax=Pseudoalteromonas tetraodonis TaxID=43659 RepID=UPI001BDE2088|nr:HNH endonuclease [Pseudoalteromonas tetraodonis]
MDHFSLKIKQEVLALHSKGNSINEAFQCFAKNKIKLSKAEKKAFRIAYENTYAIDSMTEFLSSLDFERAKNNYEISKKKSNRKLASKKLETKSYGPKFNVERYLLAKESSDSYLSSSFEIDTDASLITSQTYPYEVDEFQQKEPDLNRQSDELPLHLYVYDPEDVNELSLDEISEVWLHRYELCGTKEAAAEVLALKDINDGNVDSYQGWESYLNHDYITEFENRVKSDAVFQYDNYASQKQFKVDNPFDRKKYSRSQLIKLPLKQIIKLWEERNYCFNSVTAACEALAIIRYANKIDNQKKHWKAFLEHPQILDLDFDFDEIDDELYKHESLNKSAQKEQLDLDALSEDNRSRVTRSQVTRVGQQGFRALILDNFYLKCAISGSEEQALLEAAHIIPYKGQQSNVLQNGLCLRVDIHRLFDRFLISIEPQTLEIVVSDKVRDTYYKSFAGIKLGCSKVSVSKSLLKKHFYQFMRNN